MTSFTRVVGRAAMLAVGVALLAAPVGCRKTERNTYNILGGTGLEGEGAAVDARLGSASVANSLLGVNQNAASTSATTYGNITNDPNGIYPMPVNVNALRAASGLAAVTTLTQASAAASKTSDGKSAFILNLTNTAAGNTSIEIDDDPANVKNGFVIVLIQFPLNRRVTSDAFIFNRITNTRSPKVTFAVVSNTNAPPAFTLTSAAQVVLQSGETTHGVVNYSIAGNEIAAAGKTVTVQVRDWTGDLFSGGKGVYTSTANSVGAFTQPVTTDGSSTSTATFLLTSLDDASTTTTEKEQTFQYEAWYTSSTGESPHAKGSVKVVQLASGITRPSAPTFANSGVINPFSTTSAVTVNTTAGFTVVFFVTTSNQKVTKQTAVAGSAGSATFDAVFSEGVNTVEAYVINTSGIASNIAGTTVNIEPQKPGAAAPSIQVADTASFVPSGTSSITVSGVTAPGATVGIKFPSSDDNDGPWTDEVLLNSTFAAGPVLSGYTNGFKTATTANTTTGAFSFSLTLDTTSGTTAFQGTLPTGATDTSTYRLEKVTASQETVPTTTFSLMATDTSSGLTSETVSRVVKVDSLVPDLLDQGTSIAQVAVRVIPASFNETVFTTASASGKVKLASGTTVGSTTDGLTKLTTDEQAAVREQSLRDASLYTTSGTGSTSLATASSATSPLQFTLTGWLVDNNPSPNVSVLVQTRAPDPANASATVTLKNTYSGQGASGKSSLSGSVSGTSLNSALSAGTANPYKFALTVDVVEGLTSMVMVASDSAGNSAAVAVTPQNSTTITNNTGNSASPPAAESVLPLIRFDNTTSTATPIASGF